MRTTSLLVIGAGPYGLAVAAHAQERGIDTIVVGHPLGFWTDHMPEGMFLRSGFDWHLDASNIDTFEAFVEDRGLRPAELDPIPISVFLDYGSWFQAQKHLSVTDVLVSALERSEAGFVAWLDDGSRVIAERVVAAPGNGYFPTLPEWAQKLPEEVRAHTCDFVDFGVSGGARVLVVGGRQSAYEWAALLGEHGAERVDLVHRHDVPRFDHVSWKFVDEYVEATMRIPGWWRSLPPGEQNRISQQFWEVGRLTLEWWLVPRLQDDRIHRWPNNEVVATEVADDGTARVTLSSGDRLEVDQVVFATGYTANLPRVPYLQPLVPEIKLADGAPRLDEGFQSSMPGLYFPGFAATRDFGPFFGFTKACPAAAALIVDSLEHAC